MTFSSNFINSVLSQQSQEVILTLLTVQFTDNLGEEFVGHYVNDYIAVESINPIDGTPALFQVGAFKVALGNDTKDSVTQTSITFDSGDLQFVRELRKAEGNPKVYIQVALSSSPSVIEMGPIELQVESYTIKSTAVTANLTIEPILNEPVPALRFTPTTFPMLWRGKIDG